MSKQDDSTFDITCEWCASVTAIPMRRRTDPPRFCGRSCSAKWRTAQPQFKSALSRGGKTAAAKGGLVARWQEPEFREQNRQRMTALNPMANLATSERVAAMKRGKPFPVVRGGNGCGLTKPQEMILASFPSVVSEFSVGVPSSIRLGSGVRRYSLDLAMPERKLGIEVDGASHTTRKGRERDARKDAILASLGWSVLRVRNEDVLTRWPETQARIQSFLTLR